MAENGVAGVGGVGCNPQAALARLGDDNELYREVLQRFFADAPNTLARLDVAVADAQGDTLHRVAHSFKGLAAMAGTEEVARIAAELEQSGKKEEFDVAPDLIARIKLEVQRAELELAPFYRE